MKVKYIISFGVSFCFVLTRGQNIGSESVLTSLLRTFSSSTTSSTCPGTCYNAIYALTCDKVLDRPGLCFQQGYRCCSFNNSSDSKSDSEKVTKSIPKPETLPAVISYGEATPLNFNEKTVTLELRVDDKNKQKKDERIEEKEFGIITKEITNKDGAKPTQYSASSSVTICPGVCVAQRISNFCEAAIDVTGLCKPDLRCCVPSNLFEDVANPPIEFVILNVNQTIESDEGKSQPKPSTPSVSLPPSSMGTTRHSKPATESTTAQPTTKKQKVKINELDDSSSINSGPPGRPKCKGTCVAGFFAFLCDEIDRSGFCPQGGKCCVTQPSNKNKPRPPPLTERPLQRESYSPTKSPSRSPITTTTTTTTTKPTDPPAPPCPGTCLPFSVSSRCKSPSKLVVASGCHEDEICCDDRNRRRGEEPPRRPMDALGTLFSLFGGGKKTPRPFTRQPTTTTTTTTMPTTTTTEIILPDCPGTCIAPLLSFTCFGNAEITKHFKCNKPKQTCCAPKSSIREIIRQNEVIYTDRNDTDYPQFDSHYGPYVHQQYPHEQFDDHIYIHPTNQRPSMHPPPPPPHQTNYEPDVSNPPPPPYRPTDKHIHYPQSPDYQYSPEIDQNYYQGQDQMTDVEIPVPDVTTPAPPVLSTPSSVASIPSKYVCGIKGTQRSGRVVGGEDAVPGEWCWQVALINSLNQYLCGGALIGAHWVLTAAHCVTNIVRSGDAIYVRVGDHDLTTRYGSPGAQTIPVATTYIHHNHNSQTLDNDIALLKLSNHAELGEGVCLVCLPARGVSQVAGKRCTVTGYGYMGETGPIPLRVREAEIPIVSDNECVRKINAVTEKIFILPASSFCSGGESGHDACQGDGGGPLVCNVDNFYELSGLVSWGFGCGRQDVPGVYVKVASFIGWINQIISVNNL